MNQVRKFREALGYKQEEVSKFLGMSPANYSKKEAGSVRFSIQEAQGLSRLFNETIDNIFFADEVSKNDTFPCGEKECPSATSAVACLGERGLDGKEGGESDS